MIDRITLCSATLGEDGRADPPLGPLYIAAALEASGVEVDFRDYQTEPGATVYSGIPLADYLAGHERFLAISCFVDMLPAVIEATRRLHDEGPDTRIILGGPGPTGSATRILELYPWIEGVVRGEGEETIREWADRENGTVGSPLPIAGMTYREDGRIVEGPDRRRIADLDALPKPAYHLIDFSNYAISRVVTTRGCAYRCTFCDVTALWGNRSVYRDLDVVIDEIVALSMKVGHNVVGIVDDTFVQDRKRVRSFCEKLIARGEDVTWSCFSRINLMTPGLADLMARAGCRSVFYGIDSGSPAVADLTHKMVKPENVMPVVEFSARAFDSVEASFIWGYPFEGLDDFKLTLDLAAECARFAPKVNIQIHRLTPLPNSPIYKESRAALIEPERVDLPWLLLPAVMLDKRATVVGEIVRAAPDVYPGFFNLPTPAVDEKRELLKGIVRGLDRTTGSTLIDPEVARLLDEQVIETEQGLLASAVDSADRIGVGLAVSSFRRSRRRRLAGPSPVSIDGNRGPSLVRQRTAT